MRRIGLVLMVALAFGACNKQEAETKKSEVPVVKPEAPPEKPAGVAVPDSLIGTEAECTCGSKVAVNAETPFTIYEDHIHFFCCGHCKASFDKDPAGHLKVRNNGVPMPAAQ